MRIVLTQRIPTYELRSLVDTNGHLVAGGKTALLDEGSLTQMIAAAALRGGLVVRRVRWQRYAADGPATIN